MVFQFSASQPHDLTVWPEPPIDDRSGPPLSQGVLFTMLAMVAADALEREWLDVFEQLDPHAWYHGQLLESVLTGLERRDPTLPWSLGRSVYLLFRARLESFGLTSAAAVIANLPLLWYQATRGDSGVFRSALLGPRHAPRRARAAVQLRVRGGCGRRLHRGDGRPGHHRRSHPVHSQRRPLLRAPPALARVTGPTIPWNPRRPSRRG